MLRERNAPARVPLPANVGQPLSRWRRAHWQGPFEQRLPLVWLLLGGRKGDNNQLFALAEALGYPFEAKRLRHTPLRRFPFLRHGLTTLRRGSRALVSPPWPDLVLCVGYASVPVARFIREKSGGRAKLIHVGNPRARIDDFDLQITTPQYAREGHRLLELDLPIGNPAKSAQATPDELNWLRSLPRPRRLIAVGGPARHWELDHAVLRKAIGNVRKKAPKGSTIVSTSPRTRAATRRLLAGLMHGENEVVVDAFPNFATLLADSDEIYVTADSVSMLSEAILTHKPVGMIPIRRSFFGVLTQWFWELPTATRALPNFANFWNVLNRRRLVGTVELPVATQVCDTVDRAADAVRSLLLAPGELIDEGRV